MTDDHSEVHSGVCHRGWDYLHRSLYPRMARVAAVAALMVALGVSYAWPHDHENPELNDWYKGLHSRNGAWCCNGDDAKSAEDWSTHESHYRVRIDGEWVEVPDGAIVDGQNRAEQAKVWFYYLSALGGPARPVVRCFMPGTMS